MGCVISNNIKTHRYDNLNVLTILKCLTLPPPKAGVRRASVSLPLPP